MSDVHVRQRPIRIDLDVNQVKFDDQRCREGNSFVFDDP